MTNLSKQFDEKDLKISLYQTKLRNKLGSVYSVDEINDIFAKTRSSFLPGFGIFPAPRRDRYYRI